MWCSASCRAIQQMGLPLRCDTKCLTRHCLAYHALTRSLIHHAPLAHRARRPPRMLARSTTSWDLKLARYEGHLGISASDYVLSARVRAWFFTLDADNWSEATSRCWMAWVALNSTGRRVRVTQWRRGHCSGEIGGCGPGGSHVGMDSDLNLLLADVGRLARATNQDRARHPSRPIGSVSIFGDWFAFHHWSLGGTSLYASDGRH